MVKSYFEEIENIISYFKEIIDIQTIQKKEYNDTQLMISGVINFINNTELSFMELKNTKILEKIKYKYHFMDNEKQLIFRYDNAKHHTEIATYPHHKHTSKEIKESNEPELIDILIEIQNKIQKAS